MKIWRKQFFEKTQFGPDTLASLFKTDNAIACADALSIPATPIQTIDGGPMPLLDALPRAGGLPPTGYRSRSRSITTKRQ